MQHSSLKQRERDSIEVTFKRVLVTGKGRKREIELRLWNGRARGEGRPWQHTSRAYKLLLYFQTGWSVLLFLFSLGRPLDNLITMYENVPFLPSFPPQVITKLPSLPSSSFNQHFHRSIRSFFRNSDPNLG